MASLLRSLPLLSLPAGVLDGVDARDASPLLLEDDMAWADWGRLFEVDHRRKRSVHPEQRPISGQWLAYLGWTFESAFGLDRVRSGGRVCGSIGYIGWSNLDLGCARKCIPETRLLVARWLLHRGEEQLRWVLAILARIGRARSRVPCCALLPPRPSLRLLAAPSP